MQRITVVNLTLLLLVASLSCAQTSEGDGERGIPSYTFLSNPVYGVVWYENKYGDPQIQKKYFVKNLSSSMDNWEFLDSAETYRVEMCDTNAVAYLLLDDSAYFLVSTRLTSPATRDTLVSFHVSDSTNWLKYLDEFSLSLKYGKIAVVMPGARVQQRSVVIIDIDRIWQNDVVKTIEHCAYVKSSLDYTQFLLDLCGEFTPYKGSNDTIAVYDLMTDSLCRLSNLRGSNYNPSRLDRTAPLFYLKEESMDKRTLWKYTDLGEEAVTLPLKVGERVGSYSIYGDTLSVCILTGNGSRYLRSISGYSARK